MYEGTGSSGGLWHIPGFTRDGLTSNERSRPRSVWHTSV